MKTRRPHMGRPRTKPIPLRGRTPDPVDHGDEWDAELERRIADVREGRVKCIPFEQVMEEVRVKLAERAQARALAMTSTPGQKSTLKDEHLAALCRYRDFYGRTWKSRLRQFWEGGDKQPPCNETDTALLQQIRNAIGPRRLAKLKL